MTHNAEKKYGVVVVSYRSDDATVRFVREELSKITLPIRIVIVDNGASEQEASALSACIPEATVLPAENLGYARGNNLGVEWLVNNDAPDAILIANNDVELSPGVFEALVQQCGEHPEAAAFGPAVVGLTGDFQSPEPYMGMWKRYVWMYLASPFMRLERKQSLFALDYAGQAKEGLHYRLSGSFFLVRTSDFLAAGMFDPETFLYAEECILSERLSRIGKGCYYDPSVAVVHHHGETIGRHLDRHRSAMMQFDSMSYYYMTYKGYPRWQVRCVRFLYRLILRIREWRA